MKTENPEPRGVLAIQSLAMPLHTNANGDIFGGWLVSEMDLAGGVLAKQTSNGRITTIAIDGMVFHHPVSVGDLVSCYADLTRVGRTSMAIHIEAWITPGSHGGRRKVTEGLFTYVAIDVHGRPRPVVVPTP